MTAFGSFKQVFEEDHHYLSLLNLIDPEGRKAIEAVKEAVSKSADIEKELLQLLADTNWRCHLPAIVSIAFIRPSEFLIRQIWNTFDSGSWVSPQIAAVLFLYDPLFLSRAEQRLLHQCPVANPPDYASPIHKHTEAGPADSYGRSCKAASALATLVRKTNDLEILRLVDREEVTCMIADDIDHGGEIAEKWLEKFKSIIGLGH